MTRRGETDGFAIPQDTQNGWFYTDETMTALQLNGSACELALTGEKTVWVTFRCLLP